MNKSNIALSVLAALGIGAGINSAIQSAARENNVSIIEAQQAARDSVVDAAVVLRGLRTKEQAKQRISEDSGAPRESVDPLVESVYGQANRSPRSRFNTPIAIVCQQSQLQQCLDAWARNYCEPLKGTGETAIFRECVEVNSTVHQGAEYCTRGTKTRVMRVLKLPATDPMVERSLRNQGQFEVVYEPALAQRLAAAEPCIDDTVLP